MKKVFILLLLPKISLFSAGFLECKHLHDRTMFSVDKTHLDFCLEAKGYEDVVKTLIYKPREIENETKPQCAQKLLRPSRKMRDLNTAERKKFRKKRKASTNKKVS